MQRSQVQVLVAGQHRAHVSDMWGKFRKTLVGSRPDDTVEAWLNRLGESAKLEVEQKTRIYLQALRYGTPDNQAQKEAEFRTFMVVQPGLDDPKRRVDQMVQHLKALVAVDRGPVTGAAIG